MPYHSQCQIIYTTVLHRKEYRTVQSMNTASFINFPGLPWASLVAQMVKNPCPRQETRVQSLGQEDPLEKGTATYTSILYFFQWNAVDLFHVFKATYNMDITWKTT